MDVLYWVWIAGAGVWCVLGLLALQQMPRGEFERFATLRSLLVLLLMAATWPLWLPITLWKARR